MTRPTRSGLMREVSHFVPAYVPPPVAGSYRARAPETTRWAKREQQKYPGLYSLWLSQEHCREQGICFVCRTRWDRPERPGCGGCHDLSAYWPRPGVSDPDSWHRRYGHPPKPVQLAAF